MSKRFIIMVSSPTQAQRNAFTAHLKTTDLKWWHWLNDVWLIVDDREEWSAAKLRDQADLFTPKKRKLVFEISGKTTYAGYGPNTDESNMFRWIKSTWNRANK